MEPIFRIRKAEIADAEAIIYLVKALALYEKTPNAVKTNVEDYRQGLESRLFSCFLAEHIANGQILGMALYFPYFSTWSGKTLYLEDFFVLAESRKHGIGQALFDRFLEEAKQLNAKMVKWQVLDWNELAKDFYRKYNTEFHSGWENGIIRL